MKKKWTVNGGQWIARAIFALFTLHYSLCTVAQGATKIFLHSASSILSGYKTATQSAGSSLATATTNTASGGTDIQVTATAGGATVAWATQPLATGFTLSGTVTCNLWGLESNGQANASLRCRLYKYSGSSEGSAILTANAPGELTTSATAKNFSATPTSTAFNAGDRIIIKVFLENCNATSGCPTGTMGGSRTATLDYDGATGGADGDTYVQITENVGFRFAGTVPISLNVSPAITQSLAKNPAASVALSCPVCVETNQPLSVAFSISPAATGEGHSAGQSAAANISLGISPAGDRTSSGGGGTSVGPASSAHVSCPVCVDVNHPLNVALHLSPAATATNPGVSRAPAGAFATSPTVECCRGIPISGPSLALSPAVATPRGLQGPRAVAASISPAAGRTVGRADAVAASVAFATSASTLRALNKSPAVALSLVASPFTVQSSHSTANVDVNLALAPAAGLMGDVGFGVAASFTLAPAVTMQRAITRTASVATHNSPAVATPTRALNLGVSASLHDSPTVASGTSSSASRQGAVSLGIAPAVIRSGALHRDAAATFATNTFATAFKAVSRAPAASFSVGLAVTDVRSLHIATSAAVNIATSPFVVRGPSSGTIQVPVHVTFSTSASDRAALSKSWAAAVGIGAAATANKAVVRIPSVSIASSVALAASAGHSEIIPRIDLVVAVSATALVNAKQRIVVVTT